MKKLQNLKLKTIQQVQILLQYLTDLYRLGSITYEPNTSTYKEIQRVGRAEIYNIRKAPLTAPTTNYPIYLYEDNKALVYPETIVDPTHIKMQYVKKPTDVRWGYYTGNLGQLVHDATVYGPDLLNTGVGTLTSSITTNASGATDGTYTGKPGVTTGFLTSGSGTGLDITVTISSGVATVITINTAGTGFEVGDTITIADTVIGGASNLIITLTAANFNSGSTYGTTNFELHNSERTELVFKNATISRSSNKRSTNSTSRCIESTTRRSKRKIIINGTINRN